MGPALSLRRDRVTGAMRRTIFGLLAAAWMVSAVRPAPAAAAEVVDRVHFDNGGIAAVEIVYPNDPDQTCPTKIRKPLRARYRGDLQIVHTDDGRLAIVDQLTFAEYLQGLAEVPRSWPAETLRAQVIAARSYALYHIANPRSGAAQIGYDICSTDRCQVYRGVAVEQGAFGEAWVSAVRDTAGLALVYDGKPIQAFYFSTSSGTTRSNEEVFGGAPLPYLKPVPGADDDSPMARWTVEVPLTELAAILRRDGLWGERAIDEVRRDGSRIVISGGGASARPTVSSFRSALNGEAPCVSAERYPPRRADGSKLPQTLPSSRFDVSVSGGVARLSGRGWGHDVGMSQYGARALAEQGKPAADILAYYYGGLRPQRVAEPGAIRVMVAEGAIRIRITPENGGTLRTESGSVIGAGETYEITPGATGATVARVNAGTATPVLTVTATGEGTIESFKAFTLPVRLSGPARVTAILSKGDAEVRCDPEQSLESGEHPLTVALTDAAGAPLSDGDYSLIVEAFDGIDRVRLTAPVALRRPPASNAPSGSTFAAAPVLAGVAAALTALILIALTLRRRRF